MKSIISKYLEKRAEKKWDLNKIPNNKIYSFIICIPSYAEHNYIIQTLQSISKQNKNLLEKTLIIIVINNSSDSSLDVITSNHNTIKIIKKFLLNFEVLYVNAYTNGKELPTKYAGVGLARKIGFDLGLNYSNKNTIFCSLDADTLISKKYLNVIKNNYSSLLLDAAVINFSHQKSNSIKQEIAIKKYEKFIQSTSLNMKKSGSPYNYHSIGSTITCNANTYAAVGGMPKKKATEDFYFLESIAKYKSVHIIKDILVYPSSRISERVYLGTGYRMKQSEDGYDIDKLYFDNNSFKILQKWLELGTMGYRSSIQEILKSANNIDPKLSSFLKIEKIDLVWRGIQTSSPTQKHFIKQFHRWFDALKTLKLLKTFSNQSQ